jgi:hypothetical protein
LRTASSPSLPGFKITTILDRALIQTELLFQLSSFDGLGLFAAGSVFESSVTGATERLSMNDVIKKLTAEQALDVVKRLSEKGGEIGEAVLAEATNLLTAVNVEPTADEVFFVLDSIDVQDCWDRSVRSGPSF